jgi:alcohol dehydrogenase class IV
MPDRLQGFTQRTRVVIGAGSIETLAAHADRLDIKRIGVLMDPALVEGVVGQSIAQVQPEAAVLTTAPGEPTFDTVAATADALRDAGIDGLIAVGGGSTIDTAKLSRGLIATGASSVGKLPDLPIDSVLPLIAVPTTAGTGSEMGPSAVAVDPSTGAKVLVRVDALAANVAIADSTLTLSLPPMLTAFTGCDALAQAILAFVPATEGSISGNLAIVAIETIFANLLTAVRDGSNANARERMMLGSSLSAVAMFNSPMTYAGEHSFAEAVGPLVGIHHGHAVAVFLPLLAQYNREALANPFGEIARAARIAALDMSDNDASQLLVDRLHQLVVDLEIPPMDIGGGNHTVEELVHATQMHPGFDTNPRRIDERDAAAIIHAATHRSLTLTTEQGYR